ncbi:hypothetical protein IMY05_005G0073700 [Salix suchowensis]|nr:hypothetical protein IMY05_005G0073700 [Salix suchowensis]
MIAMEMAGQKALLGIHPETLTDLDVAAAQQLVRLSGEDSSSSSSNKKNQKETRRRKNRNIESDDFEECEVEFDRSSQNEITSKMIEDIFGKEEEVARPRKKRYRSLVVFFLQQDEDEKGYFYYQTLMEILIFCMVIAWLTIDDITLDKILISFLLFILLL